MAPLPTSRSCLDSVGGGRARVAPNLLSAEVKLLQFTSILGAAFGTAAFAKLLHSLVLMERPRTVVELGSGLGTSALWMALATEMNGYGHVYAVDDLDLLRRHNALATVIDALEQSGFGRIEATTPEVYFRQVTSAVGLQSRLTMLERHIELTDPCHFDAYPFSGALISKIPRWHRPRACGS